MKIANSTVFVGPFIKREDAPDMKAFVACSFDSGYSGFGFSVVSGVWVSAAQGR